MKLKGIKIDNKILEETWDLSRVSFFILEGYAYIS